MRISDWSSDVCSSDLAGEQQAFADGGAGDDAAAGNHGGYGGAAAVVLVVDELRRRRDFAVGPDRPVRGIDVELRHEVREVDVGPPEIGRAWCRESGCQ